MPRDTLEQRELKIKSISEAIDILIEESTSNKNKCTYENVIRLANEKYTMSFIGNESGKLKKISPTTLKSPSSKEFKILKNRIDGYRNEHKKVKNILPRQQVEKTAKLEAQVKNLVSEVVKYHDDKLQLIEKISAKDRALEKAIEERDKYYKKLCKMEKQ